MGLDTSRDKHPTSTGGGEVKSLEEYVHNLVEQPEPSTEGQWYVVDLDDLPPGVLEFHFKDTGQLTDVRLTTHKNQIIATSEIKAGE
jgi:hypothetical protein